MPLAACWGEQVRIIEVDDYCGGEQAVAGARMLVAEHVDFVIGHTCSDAAIPASKVYAEAGIPLLTTLATNPRLTEQGLTNVFRICGRDDAQGAIAARLLAKQWDGGNVAILHDGRVYGQGLAEQARKALNALGITEVLFEPIDPELLDYADLVDRVQAAQVDVLYYAGTSRPAGLIVRELRERGDDMQLISGDSIDQELSRCSRARPAMARCSPPSRILRACPIATMSSLCFVPPTSIRTTRAPCSPMLLFRPGPRRWNRPGSSSQTR